MSNEPKFLPAELVHEVERFISSEHEAATKFSNREPLDESGAFTLHRLAARIFAAGVEAGEFAEAARDRGRRERERALGDTTGEQQQ
jgi:hypothetical protein